jgi:hypothetical protein
MEHDPMVDLLSYVHAKTHSLETQNLCDRAWKHYKEVIAERDRLRGGIEKAYKVLLGISLQDGPNLSACVDGYVDTLPILIEKIQKQAIKDLHAVETERDSLKQIAERINSWETELLLANNALKEKNSQLETELENLRAVVNKTIEHIDYVVSHRTEIYVVPALRDIKQLLTTQDNEDKSNE